MEVLAHHLGINRQRIEKTFVVLPAYNEEAALTRLIPQIVGCLQTAKRPFEILVVNDGSTDRTSERLSALAADQATWELKHDVNQGYGAAIQTGLLAVLQQAASADAVVTLDADNTQDPIYIPALLNALENGFDAVTASYTMDGGHCSGVPVLRRIMSGFLNALFHLTLPLEGVTTYTNGFRAYRVSILQAVHRRYPDPLIDESGFPGGTEFFLKAAASGATMTEIPFDLHYEYRGSQSKIRLFATIKKYLRLVALGGRYASR